MKRYTLRCSEIQNNCYKIKFVRVSAQCLFPVNTASRKCPGYMSKSIRRNVRYPPLPLSNFIVLKFTRLFYCTVISSRGQKPGAIAYLSKIWGCRKFFVEKLCQICEIWS